MDAAAMVAVLNNLQSKEGLADVKKSSYHKVNQKRGVDAHVHFHLTDADIKAVPDVAGKTLKVPITEHDEYLIQKGTSKHIHVRQRVCRCEACLVQDYAHCAKAEHVPVWVSTPLEMDPNKSKLYHTRAREEEAKTGMCQTLRAGDVAAVKRGDEDQREYDYYLLRLTKSPFEVTTAMLPEGAQMLTDGYGAEFRPGDWVLQGTWFEIDPVATGGGEKVYLRPVLGAKVAMAHVCSVLKCHVQMHMTQMAALVAEEAAAGGGKRKATSQGSTAGKKSKKGRQQKQKQQQQAEDSDDDLLLYDVARVGPGRWHIPKSEHEDIMSAL